MGNNSNITKCLITHLDTDVVGTTIATFTKHSYNETFDTYSSAAQGCRLTQKLASP